MIATMSITPESNICPVKHHIIDYSNVRTVSYDWLDRITVYDKFMGKEFETIVEKVSLFNQVLVLAGSRYKILCMLSKPSPEKKTCA